MPACLLACLPARRCGCCFRTGCGAVNLTPTGSKNFPRVRAEHDEEVNASDANSIGKPCDQTVIPCWRRIGSSRRPGTQTGRGLAYLVVGSRRNWMMNKT
jgi:hypothetical protein